MKKLLTAVLCAAMLLSLAACGEGPGTLPEPDAEDVPTPTGTPEPTPSPTPTPFYDPLSGEVIEEDISMDRPWAVMINNLQQALPQCGVSEAELLYEIPAEGGITRMMAVFTDISGVEKLGSMRSIRPYYGEVGMSYDAIIVHAGGSEAGYSLLRDNDWDHLDGVRETYAAAPFQRDPDRMQYGVEHSLFANGPKLIEAAEEKGFAFEHDGEYDYGLSFDDDAAEQCTDEAEFAQINFNSYKYTRFRYNAGEGVYYAEQYGEPYMDADYDVQLSFANLLFLQTEIKVIDSYGRLDVELTGEGSGWFVTGGRCVEITWQRDGLTSPFHYYLADGSELSLSPGHSYIGIMGNDAGCTVSFEEAE